MKKPFQLKAISTRFQGYHFRSRLEARHAVFFSELGIEYRYESEGYVLEGTPYLPDFYLPKHDCFIEVKGDLPTQDELEKASLLALYAGKDVYIFYGEIGPSLNEGWSSAIRCFQPDIYTSTLEDGKSIGHFVEVSHEALIILQKIEEAGFHVETEKGRITFEFAHSSWDLDEDELELLTYRIQAMSKLPSLVFPVINDYADELYKVLTPEEGWWTSFHEQSTSPRYGWQECSACREIVLYIRDGHPHEGCKGDGNLDAKSPRLMKAYTAARSARFEHGEKPGNGSEGRKR